MTTVLNINYQKIKWNPFLLNLEFTTLSNKLFTFWRVNTNEITLQYQHGDIDIDYSQSELDFTCMEYTPPLSVNCVILLLIGLNNGEIWGIDTKTNSLNIKFKNEELNLQGKFIKNIFCNLKYISLQYDNKIKNFKLPFLKEINYDDLNIFQNFKNANLIELDSDIFAVDFDRLSSEGIALSKKGTLYCLNIEENFSLRLQNFISDEIVKIKIINKDYQNYSLRKIDFDNLEFEEISENFRKDQFFIITQHKGGAIRIWSIPEYSNLVNFEVVTEEILNFDINNDLKIAVSYDSGIIRFFDILKEAFIGKYKSISGQSYKFLKFLPCGQYLFAIDITNTIFLIKIEKFDNLLIQIHQLFNISGDVMDFKLSICENYNKFLVNIQNVYLNVYNRKFTNILKNVSYDNSVPVFYLQDKFNTDEYLKNNENINLDKNELSPIENFQFEFSPNLEEKNIIYIQSQARKLILIRNYESHTINKVIKLDNNPINFSICSNSAYISYLFKDKIGISQLGQNLSIKQNLILNEKIKDFSISQNGKIMIVYNDTSLIFYNLKYI